MGRGFEPRGVSRGGEGSVTVSLGPMPAETVLVWTENTIRIVQALAESKDKLPFRFPDDVSLTFEDYLYEWREVARRSGVFEWEEEADVAFVRHLVTYWFNISSMSDEELGRFGVTWSPPEGAPFFDALAGAVVAALAEAGEEDFANALRNSGFGEAAQ